MKLFLDYLNKIKLQILLMLFPTILTGMIFLLYQLPMEPILYIAVLWILTGLGTCAFGFHNYQKNIHNLQIISAAPDINLSRMDAPSNEADALQQEIMHSLNRMRIDAETANQKTLEEMTDYYTMWAHQIKTPIAASRLILQSAQEECCDENRQEVFLELKEEISRIDQYADMVMCYLRLDTGTTDYVIREYELDGIVRQAVRMYASVFIRKKLRLIYEPLELKILTDEKWLLFVISQVLSNALKYTPSGTVTIYKKEPQTLCIKDTGIGIAPEDLPRIFEKGYTGSNGRADKKASGIGLYLSKRICTNLGHKITVHSVPGEGTEVCICLERVDLEIE